MAAKSGAAIPPILATTDAEPIAVFRMMVGYNSAVNKYFGVAATPNLPEKNCRLKKIHMIGRKVIFYQ